MHTLQINPRRLTVHPHPQKDGMSFVNFHDADCGASVMTLVIETDRAERLRDAWEQKDG